MPDRFTQPELDAIKTVARRRLAGPSRRTILGGVATLAGGAALGGAATRRLGTAAADPSTTDGDGDLGQPSNRVDVFADGVDATSVHNDAYYEAVDDLGTTSGSTTLDLSAANMAVVTLGGDISFSFANANAAPHPGNSLLLKIQQDGSTQHTITWPSVNWIGGAAPPDPATSEELEVFVESYDGGSTWYGGEAGRYP